ncbi:MAG: bifunctional methylenetetrahydrofolate dehydrogenase/methenyltetrahydrofolate cyclohydrolase, partial [Alphaproteobacteria bacterium PRO2]|nr:bifunctional methylenetetrahydrofolate dehydrogenase/methenyltetrahydrofolate cyclohydrolase [Alphaproteobacteria bacterium PRO2]
MTGTARIIDGKSLAANLRADIARQVSGMKTKPGLAVILVGDDPASHVYVGNKIKACKEVGIESFERKMDANVSSSKIRDTIRQLNHDPKVHGILMQLPLPERLSKDEDELVQTIAPEKDVDGLTISNVGKLVAGLPGMVPCTPQGALLLIKSVEKNLTGLNAVVIGRSLLFGKPMAQLLLAENCTVTQAHSKT